MSFVIAACTDQLSRIDA